MKTIEAIKEIAWQVAIEEFVDDENEQELINRMRDYINVGHEELGLDAVVIECAEDATDEQIITAINEYLKEIDEKKIVMTQEEKQLLYEPKWWALYCNNEFIYAYPSHKSAKAALHRKCEEMKNAPYECDGEYYTIKPYNHG